MVGSALSPINPFQVGGGFSDLIVPANGSLLATLATGGLHYREWIRWVMPMYRTLMTPGTPALVLAVAIGFWPSYAVTSDFS
jgi:uncharacterized ion transporter superfamily protein YfcC